MRMRGRIGVASLGLIAVASMPGCEAVQGVWDEVNSGLNSANRTVASAGETVESAGDLVKTTQSSLPNSSDGSGGGVGSAGVGGGGSGVAGGVASSSSPQAGGAEASRTSLGGLRVSPRSASLVGSAATEVEVLLTSGGSYAYFAGLPGGKGASGGDFFITEDGEVGAAVRQGTGVVLYDGERFETVGEDGAPSGAREGSMGVSWFPGNVMFRTWHVPGEGYAHGEVGRYEGGRFRRLLGKGDRVPFASNERVWEVGVVRAHRSGLAVIRLETVVVGTRKETDRHAVLLPSGDLVWGSEFDELVGGAVEQSTISDRGVLVHGARRGDAYGPVLVKPSGEIEVLGAIGSGFAVPGSLEHSGGFVMKVGRERGRVHAYEFSGETRSIDFPPGAVLRESMGTVGGRQTAGVTPTGRVVIARDEEIVEEQTRSMRMQERRDVERVFIEDAGGVFRRIDLGVEVGGAATPDGGVVHTADQLRVLHASGRGVLLGGSVAEAKLTPRFRGTGYFAIADGEVGALILEGMKGRVEGVGGVTISDMKLMATSPDGAWVLISAAYEGDGADGAPERGGLLFRLRMPLPVEG